MKRNEGIHRYDISGEAWERIKELLPGQAGKREGADCSQAPLLADDLEVEAFLSDKAYDTNELLDMFKEAHISAVIPPVKSRKEQRAYNRELYRARHVIANVFRALKL